MPPTFADPTVETPDVPLDETGWPLLPPTLVTIHRTSPEDERSRSIFCAVDGRPVAQLLFGQSWTCEVPPGGHSLRVHNTLVWKTTGFEVSPGGHVHFTVWNRPCLGYYPLILLLGAAPIWIGLSRGAPAR